MQPRIVIVTENDKDRSEVTGVWCFESEDEAGEFVRDRMVDIIEDSDVDLEEYTGEDTDFDDLYYWDIDALKSLFYSLYDDEYHYTWLQIFRDVTVKPAGKKKEVFVGVVQDDVGNFLRTEKVCTYEASEALALLEAKVTRKERLVSWSRA